MNLYFRYHCSVALSIFDLTQVGQDVVGELTKAMERVGLDMRVTALVSSFRPYTSYTFTHFNFLLSAVRCPFIYLNLDNTVFQDQL